MKILVTGGTSKQVKPPEMRGNSGSKTIDVPAYIVEAMRQAGHTVEWRHVTPGEDLDSFDLVWMGWAPWLSRTTPNTVSAMWAWKSGVPRVVFLDDWAFHQGFSHSNTLAYAKDKADPEEFYLTRPDYCGGAAKWTEDDLRRFLPLIRGAAAEMTDPTTWTKTSVVCPMYGWGDVSIPKADRYWRGADLPFFKLDPSSWVIREEQLEEALRVMPTKECRWVMGSLSPQKEWVDKQLLRWPVSYFGCRSLNRKGTDSPRLATEADVLREYAGSVGVISAPYNRHVGDGWFRSRYLYAAMGQSYLLTGPSDEPPGTPYRTGNEVEAMTRQEIQRATHAQSEAVLSSIWSADKFSEQVARLCAWTAALQ